MPLNDQTKPDLSVLSLKIIIINQVTNNNNNNNDNNNNKTEDLVYCAPS